MTESEKRPTNFAAAAAYVDANLARKREGELESASGSGSRVEATGPVRALIEETIEKYGVRSILDLGCGDWNWMRLVRLYSPSDGERVRYEGWESNAKLVDMLNKTYGDGATRFYVKDVASEEFPTADLIIARDILFHMPIAVSETVVVEARRKCRYFLSTSHADVKENNGPQPTKIKVDGWGFYRMNLHIKPFNLAGDLLESRAEPACGQNRYANLYDFS